VKQEHFEALHAASWQAFEQYLATDARQRKAGKIMPPFADAEFAPRYRALCQQLALARDRDYALSLVNDLHRLVQAGHDRLYQARAGLGTRAWHYAVSGFAQDVRRNARWILAAAVLMFGPAIAMMLAVRAAPDLAYLLLTPSEVAKFESMYAHDADTLGRVARDASTDVAMFGFYIFNNVSIAFRCFAGGITFGVLSIFALVFNGLYFGIVEARLALAGLGSNFSSFVIGHAGFELGAIVLSGGAGLRLGMALVAPGLRTRRRALHETARDLVGVVCGLAVMLCIAALIEAFWSPLRLDPFIKYGVGGLLSGLPVLYFIFAGRRHGP
jgi:uncharacterized membrane protein SpoIIM required for sporulation